MKKLTVALLFSSAVMAFGGQADAATWNIEYDTPSNGVTTDLIVTTSATPISGQSFNDAAGLSVQNGGVYVGGQFVPITQLQGYSITSITGTRSDSAGIISMYGNPGTVSAGTTAVQYVTGYIFDNVAYNTKGLPVVDVLGLEYQVGTGSAANLYNFYSTSNTGSGQAGYMENVIQATLRSVTVDSSVPLGSQVTAVPLPAALPMFAAALFGFGGFGLRKKNASQPS